LKRKWKITLGILLVLLVAGGIFASVRWSRRGIVTVQSGRVVRQDLASIVTASGEIKPRNYVNIGSNAMSPSRIVDILVKEGDQVRKGQLLARLESVQPEAEVAGQKAALSSTEAESAAAEAAVRSADENLRTAMAGVDRAKAELERARTNFERTQLLYKDQLIARQQFDTAKAEFDALSAAVRESEARVAQATAQRAQIAANLAAVQRRINVAQANVRRASDVLQRTQAVSPLEGVVTNLPVRVGETVVPGIQNSPASLIMTIADMSLITAQVKLDETDVVNVQIGQLADITIDAIPTGRSRAG
jgi:HlyD family secretion protein